MTIAMVGLVALTAWLQWPRWEKERMARFLIRADTTEIERTALRIINRKGQSEFKRVFCEAIRHDDPEVRYRAAWVLGIFTATVKESTNSSRLSTDPVILALL